MGWIDARQLSENGTARTSGVGALFEERTAHLLPTHSQYFCEWMSLIELEYAAIFRQRQEMWTLPASDREKRGRYARLCQMDGPTPLGPLLAHSFSFSFSCSLSPCLQLHCQSGAGTHGAARALVPLHLCALRLAVPGTRPHRIGANGKRFGGDLGRKRSAGDEQRVCAVSLRHAYRGRTGVRAASTKRWWWLILAAPCVDWVHNRAVCTDLCVCVCLLRANSNRVRPPRNYGALTRPRPPRC